MLTNIIEMQNKDLKQWVAIARQVQLISGASKINEPQARSDAKILYDMYKLVNIK